MLTRTNLPDTVGVTKERGLSKPLSFRDLHRLGQDAVDVDGRRVVLPSTSTH